MTASAWRQRLLVPLLALGVFAIINTEMGVVGMVPLISEYFGVSIPAAGWSVTIFALVITGAGPVMPLLLARFNRKHVLLLVLALFVICCTIAAFTTSFALMLGTRALAALFHPVYVGLAFTVAAQSVAPEARLRPSRTSSLAFQRAWSWASQQQAISPMSSLIAPRCSSLL